MTVCVLVVGGSLTARASLAQAITLRIGVVTPRAATVAEQSALRGIRLGVGEARQTASLFGSSVEVYEASSGDPTRGTLAAADSLATRHRVQVLIGTSAADAGILSRFAESRRLIFFNVASRQGALRAACLSSSFHIEASDAMYANAWRLGLPSRVSLPGHAAIPPAGAVALWDRRLERFGAGQLNDRFRALTKSEMDGAAWAAWLAVKIAAESALRVGSSDAARIRAYLESPDTQFDGHKGWPLSFRGVDHQLRQPLYIVAATPRTSPALGTSAVTDVPDLRDVSTAPGGQDAQAVLDRLAVGSVRCPWGSR